MRVCAYSIYALWQFSHICAIYVCVSILYVYNVSLCYTLCRQQCMMYVCMNMIHMMYESVGEARGQVVIMFIVIRSHNAMNHEAAA